jgi:nucleotide-binding universal stress UspA family protein
VFQEALERPWPIGTSFSLITVVDPFFFTKVPILFAETREEAHKFLEEHRERFGKAGWQAQTEVILGNPRKEITKYAEDSRAELVLVGSHGLSALERLAMGSTARAVLRDAKCSVEIVRAQKKEAAGGRHGKRILVATDGSEFSTAAVKAIAERPWPDGTEVKIISVPEFTLWLGEDPYFQRAQVEELNESALDAARAAVEGAKEILRKAGPQASTEVPFRRGAAAQLILEEAKAWNADLIVVGSHGRRRFDRWAMGSVSESLALNAPCSVEVVRTPASREMSEKERETHESERNYDGQAVHVQ